MERVRCGDVDGVDFGVGDQFFVGTVAIRGVVLLGEGLGALQVARTDRDQLAVRGGLQAFGELVGDAARAENAPADGCNHGCSWRS